jgi:hypothetical protein
MRLPQQQVQNNRGLKHWMGLYIGFAMGHRWLAFLGHGSQGQQHKQLRVQQSAVSWVAGAAKVGGSVDASGGTQPCRAVTPVAGMQLNCQLVSPRQLYTTTQAAGMQPDCCGHLSVISR